MNTVTPPIYLALDGCHGTGTSSHSDALAEALRAEHFAAQAYHHPRHPEGCDGVARVAWYAGARAQLAAHPTAPIVVMDRGPMSGAIYAHSMCEGLTLVRGRSDRFVEAIRLAEADYRRWGSVHGLRWSWLDAADEVIDARLRERREDPKHSIDERRAWRHDAALTLPRRERVDTGRPVEEVRADLLAWALAVILLRMVAR